MKRFFVLPVTVVLAREAGRRRVCTGRPAHHPSIPRIFLFA